MTKRRPRLILPKNGAGLSHEELALLRQHFEIVDDDSSITEPSIESGQQPTPIPKREENQKLHEFIPIELAGQTLLNLDSKSIINLNSIQRLKQLEEGIARIVCDFMKFNHFEVRLLNKETSQLELVIAVGMKPLEVGVTIYARPEGNGISGWVASTCESYICKSVKDDPRYTTGLENAGSTLTVPLKLGEVIFGIFNIESNEVNAFDEVDREKAEILAMYIAASLHLLNLLVVERYTTRKNTLDTLSEEIRSQLDHVTDAVEILRTNQNLSAAEREAVEQISQCVENSKAGISNCSEGPQTLLGVDRALAEGKFYPQLCDRYILVVDDDEPIRVTICDILERSGCKVISCISGEEAVKAMTDMSDENKPLDAVISDVKLPDLNGYEIFRSARIYYGDIPVILMTGFGYDPHHSIVRASQEGLQSILFKPFRAQQLLDEILRAVAK